jgi:ribosomal protein RSM22 (predicted rRNA methylase)
MKLEVLKKHVLEPINESELIRLLHDISAGFTTSRDKIGDYLVDRKKVAAYSLYYLPTNFPKFSFVMDRLQKEVQSLISDSLLIDCGSGPGTYSLAFLDWLKTNDKSNPELPLALYDKSPLMLEQAGEYVTKIYNHKNLFTSTSLRELKEYVGKYKIKKTLLFGNSYNEMSEKDFNELFRAVEPDFLIFIEPGTKSSFRSLLPLREKLLESGHDLLFPCAREKKNCPMSSNPKFADDWCHQVLKTSHDPEIERLSQILKLDRRSLPLSAFVYSKEKIEVDKNSGPLEGRVIRQLRETKFSFDLVVCANDSQEDLVEVEIQKKSMDKKTAKTFFDESVGLYYEGEVTKELGEGRVRATLSKII